MIQSILAVIQFELSRILTVQRMLLAVVMVLFPPFMTFLLLSTGTLSHGELSTSVLSGMTCLLSLLLWATPNVYTELEGRSWTFVTSRPYGRLAILFGKYVIAAAWAFVVSEIGMTLCVLQLGESRLISGLSVVQVWTALSALLFLASMVYAAVFSLFGVLAQRRAMVVSVIWFLMFEVVFAMVPAVIGKFTMTYHLLSLLLQWVEWIFSQTGEELDEFKMLYGIAPPWVHLSAIVGMTVFALAAAAFVIRWREYLTLEDAQV